MSKNLTAKQLKFAQLVASGETKADAYRQSYDVRTTKADRIASRASTISKNPEVAEMIKKLRDPVAHKIGITLEGHLKTLNDIAIEARANGHYSAAVTAEIARAKAVGLYVERHESRNLNMNVNAELSTMEMREIASKLLNSV